MASTSPSRRRGAAARAADVAVLVLHGPNLNLLGSGDDRTRGTETLAEIDARLVGEGARRGVAVSAFQSNHEGALVDRVHVARDEGVRFVIVNPGSLAPELVALRDALVMTGIPYIEVRMGNPALAGADAVHSRLSATAVGTIAGLGSRGYDFALAYALARLQG
jgi:3-dehydroquinate dehydratase-2